MDYSDFYAIAEYGNKNWKGGYKPKEIEALAHEYFEAYSSSVDTTALADLRELLEADYNNMKDDDPEIVNVKRWITALDKIVVS